MPGRHLDRSLFEHEMLNQTMEVLEQKSHKFEDERNYIEWVYYKVHRKHLKRYKQYSSMSETLYDGRYDCVTGTALYAAIYSSLGFDVAIKESTYHIFLLVETRHGKVLVESTDPINGVITNPDIMQGWLSGNLPVSSVSTGEQPFEPILNKDITMEMLAGLLHFNQSVRHFNEGRYTKAMGYIEAGIKHYPSDRMFRMAAIIAQGMRESTTVDPIIVKIYCEKYLNESIRVAATN